MYFVDDNFLERKLCGLKEGGIVRNNAFIEFLINNRPDTRFVNLKLTHRIFKYLNTIKFLFYALTIRNDKVLFLYPKVGLPILLNGIRGRFFRKLFLFSTKILIKHNNSLIFDISDLKYEQAIDLEIEGLDRELIKDFEALLFSLGQKYIFASYSMRDYAVKTHNIPYENTEVCINGGFMPTNENGELPIEISKDKINYVYAGTLNKGRMIEQMIDSFPQREDTNLFLLGVGGEWIEEYLNTTNKKNILYLGAFEEDTARNIVARCDVGLIPYDDKRLYYNIAYPTKLSFYITAGIPYMSTPVAEVNLVQDKNKMGFVKPMSEWNEVFSSMSREEIAKNKDRICSEKKFFLWEEIFKDCRFI